MATTKEVLEKKELLIDLQAIPRLPSGYVEISSNVELVKEKCYSSSMKLLAVNQTGNSYRKILDYFEEFDQRFPGNAPARDFYENHPNAIPAEWRTKGEIKVIFPGSCFKRIAASITSYFVPCLMVTKNSCKALEIPISHTLGVDCYVAYYT